MFNVDFTILIRWLTPHALRKSKLLIFLKAFAWPVSQLHNDFLRFVAAKLYRLSHNGQVCYLEKVLNDAFDVISKRIYIGDFEGVERIYFWPELDNRDVNFGVDQFFYEDAAYADSGVDFVVHVPFGVAASIPQLALMNSLLNEYKLAGKNYLIQRF